MGFVLCSLSHIIWFIWFIIFFFVFVIPARPPALTHLQFKTPPLCCLVQRSMSLINSWPFLSFHLLLFDPKMADAPRKENDNEEKKHGPSFFASVAIINARTQQQAHLTRHNELIRRESLTLPKSLQQATLCDQLIIHICTNDGKEEKLQSFLGGGISLYRIQTVYRYRIAYMHCSFVLCVRAVIFGQRLSFIDVLPVFCFVRVCTRTHSLFLSNKYPLISFFLAVYRGVIYIQ